MYMKILVEYMVCWCAIKQGYTQFIRELRPKEVYTLE